MNKLINENESFLYYEILKSNILKYYINTISIRAENEIYIEIKISFIQITKTGRYFHDINCIL